MTLKHGKQQTVVGEKNLSVFSTICYFLDIVLSMRNLTVRYFQFKRSLQKLKTHFSMVSFILKRRRVPKSWLSGYTYIWFISSSSYFLYFSFVIFYHLYHRNFKIVFAFFPIFFERGLGLKEYL